MSPVQAPAEDRYRAEQAESDDQQTGGECPPVFLSQKIEHKKNRKYLDCYSEGHERAGQPVALAPSGPTGGGEDAQQKDIVLTVEKIAMQRETHREQNPCL